ncbi:MAG: phosphatidate cytidylyltransferase [Paramuribaculum sp.]|nr:phosphatidate cytidylyltransferase [Paramuribaculum sp.]MDE7448846.1 phosphatidate cytidylyltransferase [Paramuribaculum sp.]
MALTGLIKRSATGIVYVACIVCSLIFFNGWAFMSLCMLFCGLAIIELQHLLPMHVSKGRGLLRGLDLAAGLLCVALPPINLLVAIFAGEWNLMLGGGIALMCLLLLYIARFVAQLYVHSSNSVTDMAGSMFGFMYIAVPLTLLSMLYSLYGSPLVLAMFIMIWLNDTGAFCVGSLIGRRRLFERISPKKSWEGFWGGMLFCVASAFLIKYCFGDYSTGMGIWQLCGMGVVVSVFSTWGDLVESLIKRTIGVKDSGTLLPGHGGILDRIDSLLITAPAVFIYTGILLLLGSLA